MQMEGRGDNHHSWDRIPLFLAKKYLYVVSFSTSNYNTRNVRVHFPLSIKDEIEEIIYNWGQQQPWRPERELAATRMIKYLETHLLIGTEGDDPGPKGELGVVGPDYEYSLSSNIPAVKRLTDEEYKKKMEQATIDYIQSFADRQIFTTEDKLKNGEI